MGKPSELALLVDNYGVSLAIWDHTVS